MQYKFKMQYIVFQLAGQAGRLTYVPLLHRGAQLAQAMPLKFTASFIGTQGHGTRPSGRARLGATARARECVRLPLPVPDSRTTLPVRVRPEQQLRQQHTHPALTASRELVCKSQKSFLCRGHAFLCAESCRRRSGCPASEHSCRYDSFSVSLQAGVWCDTGWQLRTTGGNQ